MKKCRQHKDLDWLQYVQDQSGHRDHFELALATCDDCLKVYLQAVEADLDVPSHQFTDLVMAGLQMNSKSSNYTRFRPFLHYVAAACLTLAFLELGVFDLIPGLSDRSQEFLPKADRIGELMEQIRLLIGHLKI